MTIQSPLNFKQIQRISELNLPTLERHHLSLLAHCLESFKTMNTKLKGNSFPTKSEQLEWCMKNEAIANDKDFISLLINQFSIAAIRLDAIAKEFKIEPMDLTLDHLISHALNKVDN
mgnify:CR=1 FL=1